MHAFESYRLSYVNFYDNFFSGLNEGGAVTHGSGRDQAYFAFAEVDDFANFYDCNINVATVFIETIAGHLSNMAQVQVGVFYFTAVDSFTHIVVGLVGQTTVNYVNQCRVHFGTYGCASPKVDFERSGFSSFSESQRNSFRVTRRGKTRGTYVVTILYEFCSSFSGHNFVSYYVTNAIFNVDHVFLPPYFRTLCLLRFPLYKTYLQSAKSSPTHKTLPVLKVFPKILQTLHRFQ